MSTELARDLGEATRDFVAGIFCRDFPRAVLLLTVRPCQSQSPPLPIVSQSRRNPHICCDRIEIDTLKLASSLPSP